MLLCVSNRFLFAVCFKRQMGIGSARCTIINNLQACSVHWRWAQRCLNSRSFQYDDSQHSTTWISEMQERWVCSLLVSNKHGPLCHYTHGSGQVSPICALRGSFVGDLIRVPKSLHKRIAFHDSAETTCFWRHFQYWFKTKVCMQSDDNLILSPILHGIVSALFQLSI